MEFIIKFPQDINVGDFDYVNVEWTMDDKLLNAFSCGGTVDQVQTIIKSGANVNYKNKNGWTALHYACQEYILLELLMVKMLVNEKADLHAKESSILMKMKC